MPDAARTRVQEAFASGALRVVWATNDQRARLLEEHLATIEEQRRREAAELHRHIDELRRAVTAERARAVSIAVNVDGVPRSSDATRVHATCLGLTKRPSIGPRLTYVVDPLVGVDPRAEDRGRRHSGGWRDYTHAMKAVALFVMLLAVSLAAAPSPEVLRVREWRAKNEGAILTELMQLIAVPNVASDRPNIAKNADVLTSMFAKRGFQVARWETKGSPILFARREAANPRGSVIFYFHYDGQASDPTEWTRGAPYSPAAYIGDKPFTITPQSSGVDPDVRIYGRSTSDDKGPIVALLAALDGLIATNATIPWSIRVVLDGEEEAGSRNFDSTMLQHAADVKSDLAIIVDSPRHASGLPTVYYGSRGGASATIKVHGALGDLHSGNYGNFVTDPGMALSRLIASMKDATGHVTIQGFYDDVVPLTATERRAIDEMPNIDQKLLEEFGLARAEHPDSRIELQHNRPTLSILGLESGNVYTGTRSAIPGSASARIEMRLVKGLNATKMVDLLVAHIRAQGFHVVDKEPDMATRRKYPLIAQVTRGGGGGFPIAKTNMDNPITAKAADAIRALDQRLVQMPTIGGSLPFATFSETLALPSIGLAVVNFDNNQHAAHENIRVGHFWEAIDIFAAMVTMPR